MAENNQAILTPSEEELAEILKEVEFFLEMDNADEFAGDPAWDESATDKGAEDDLYLVE